MTLLDMENKDSILSALNGLDSEGSESMPPILDEYLREVAKHGKTFIPWIHIKPLILRKFNNVVDQFVDDVDESAFPNMPQPSELEDLRERVFKVLNQLEGTPFTIQRLCELLTEPRRHYTRPDKYLRGFEQVCMVVSTVDCYGNKIHNVDPRRSGTIERSTPTNLNGSSVECASNSSAEDSSSSNKRSDDDDDVDDDRTESPTRPSVNFYRSLADRSSPKFPDIHQKLIKGNVLGSFSSGIPNKYTLSRPFFGAREASSSFVPITEGSVDVPLVEDEDDSDEKRKENIRDRRGDEEVLEEMVGVEAVTTSHSLTGIQKLFLEKISPKAGASTNTVPSIDQMLRPMGQLEAFVNTISMTSATNVTSQSVVTSISASSDENEDNVAKEPSVHTDKEDVPGVEIPIKDDDSKGSGEETLVNEGEEESAELPENNETQSVPVVYSRLSLKRDSLTMLGGAEDEESDSDANLAGEVPRTPKRIRVDEKEAGKSAFVIPLESEEYSTKSSNPCTLKEASVLTAEGRDQPEGVEEQEPSEEESAETEALESSCGLTCELVGQKGIENEGKEATPDITETGTKQTSNGDVKAVAEDEKESKNPNVSADTSS